MDFIFNLMTQEQAEIIAFEWHYDGKFSFYNMESDQEDLESFLDEAGRGDSYYVVLRNNELVGFFSFRRVMGNELVIGLGMRPDLIGRGNGLLFLQSGIDFAAQSFRPDKLTLTVATFNDRAIKVYKKAGFIEDETYMQKTNGKFYEFLKMIYYIKE